MLINPVTHCYCYEENSFNFIKNIQSIVYSIIVGCCVQTN